MSDYRGETTFRVTYLVTFPVDAHDDPSSVLDGAISALEDVTGAIDAETGCDGVEADENDVSVEDVTEELRLKREAESAWKKAWSALEASGVDPAEARLLLRRAARLEVTS